MINLPEEYEKEMRSLLGAEFEEYKKIYEQPVRQGLRFNPYKLTKPVWEEIMPFEKEEIPWVENGYYIHGGEGNPARHPYYFAGFVCGSGRKGYGAGREITGKRFFAGK